MPNDKNGLDFDKVVDVGLIDRWLRGVVQFVPKPSDVHKTPAVPGMEVIEHDFNTHTTQDSALEKLNAADIEKMVGFRQLLAACSQANIRLDVALLGRGALEVAFEPAEAFSKSRVFGSSYANVLPVIFGAKPIAIKN